MRGRLALLSLALLAGCVGSQQTPRPDGGPTIESGAIVGEVSDARNRARIHTELGALYYARGNMGVALEELRVAVAADPSYATGHGMMGLIYMDLKENRLAEASFEQALRLSPNDPDINHNYAWFLCQTGREPDSIKFFMQALRNPLYPTPWRSNSAAGTCSMKVKNVKDAETFFQQALKLEPDDPVSLLGLAQIRYAQADYQESRKLVARYNKLLEPTAESLWLALRVERRLGQRLIEGQFANQLRRRYPNSPEYEALQRGRYD